MQLERIEVANFKSYLGAHAVGPLDRFTSVVGPNGAGKSNLLDAVLFAMGVPTGALRVRSASELVARGADECSVRVHLCGRVFERRLSAGGTGAYLCDGARVSAGTYTERLEALGVFGRTKNFVVCQGDVARAEVDLLGMVEHVCGSGALAADYGRLEGELAAANKELSQKYERRRGYLECLREAREGRESEDALERLVGRRDVLQRLIYLAEIRRKSAELARVEAGTEELRAAAARCAQAEGLREMEAARAETVRLQKEYFEREGELAFLRGRASGGGCLDEKRAELASLEAERQRLEGAIGERAGGMRSLADVVEFERRLRDAAPEVGAREDAYRRTVEEREKRLAELTLANFDKVSRREQLRTNRRGVCAKIAALKQREQRERADAEARAARRGVLREEMEALGKRIEDRAERYDQIVADEQRLNSELSAVVGEILMGKARKSDATRRSMIGSTVESLRGIFSGVHGKVIDLVTPIQKRYELSVGVLLASHDCAVVVDSEEVALDCVRYLKEARACKLTFLPLSRLRAADVPEDGGCGRGDGPARLARRCIKYDPRYAPVVDFVFRNSLIVDSVGLARRMAYEEGYRGSICTLGGLLVTPAGIITGGREARNRFDENAMDRLLARRAAILADLGVVRDRKEAFADVQAAKERMAELSRQVAELDAVGGCCSAAEELECLRGEDAALERELAALDAELQGFEEQRREIRLFMKTAEREVFSDVLGRLGLGTLEEYKSKLYEMGDMKGRYLRLEALDDDIRALREEVAALDGPQSSGAGCGIGQLEREVRELHGRLEQSKSRLRDVSAALKSAERERSELNRRILGNELLRAKLEEELKDLRNYALVECGISGDGLQDAENRANVGPSAARCAPGDGESLEALHAELREVNRNIEESAPPATAHDGDAVARYALSNREYAEAKEHAAELRRRFYEVKQARMAAFSECFTAVAGEVARVYRMLCRGGGDEGNAYIVYEGDPFVNNLRYYLMPPNKRFAEFRELSGGERSLALLSFIFSLNSYRKAPFYVLDEVDAALDRANVERLAGYVRDAPEQFLVISHKQQVFQHSDMLVGVYRCPRERVSRVLAYRLRAG